MLYAFWYRPESRHITLAFIRIPSPSNSRLLSLKDWGTGSSISVGRPAYTCWGLSPAWGPTLLALCSRGVKVAPAGALHPQGGPEAKLSGMRGSLPTSLTIASLRQTRGDEMWPSLNSLTSNSGCHCGLISVDFLWNSAFIPPYPPAGSARQLITHWQSCGCSLSWHLY